MAAARICLAALTVCLSAASATAACPDRVGVGVGDTLVSIARACGISVETLRDANPGLNADTLRAGTFVAVPRPALPTPQRPVGRPSINTMPSLVPPATAVSPPSVAIPPPPPRRPFPPPPPLPGFEPHQPGGQPPIFGTPPFR